MIRFSTLIVALSLAAGGLSNTKYILRYTESEPLNTFLDRYQLDLEASVAGRPIHSVIDPLGRNPQSLIERIDSENDGDVTIEEDQVLELPILQFPEPQFGGQSALNWAARQTRPTKYFGRAVPLGFVRQLTVNQASIGQSWTAHGGGTGIVAIIDTGVDLEHPALSGSVISGIDYITALGNGSELTGLPPSILALINPTTTPLLGRTFAHVSNGHAGSFERSVRLNSAFSTMPIGLGHGTMVAGAVLLVAPDATILPIRAFSQNGQGRLFDVIRGIHAAEDRGAKVVNLSLNTYVQSPEFELTCNEVSDRGVILVASTGNDGLTNIPSYPASYTKVTGVASVSGQGVRSLFSNAGGSLTLVGAPGEGLYLPFPGNRFAGGWGTSFAAPLVSGLAAKILSAKPSATYSDLQSALSHGNPSSDPNLNGLTLNVFQSITGL